MAKSAKKQKEKKPTQDEANTPIDSISNQNSSFSNSTSNLFNSLFGEIPEENAAVSIFSNNNPFRRKPYDSSRAPPNRQQLQSGAEIPSDMLGGLETSGGSSELKKTKRKKETIRDFEGGNEVERTPWEENEADERKKLKRVEYGNFESGKGRNGRTSRDSREKEVNSGSEENLKSDGKAMKLVEGHNEEKKNEKKNKKRKRDEVEAEYEAKKYGVTEQEEKGEGGGVVGRKRKEMESVEDIMVSKEGFDDESKLLRTVFVGNLPLKIKRKMLIREFGKFGEVESVRIRSVPLTDSKVPRKGAIIKKQINEAGDSVHAYVVFKTEKSAQASLAHNMAVVGGNHIRVDRACPPRKKLKGADAPLYDNRRTVFVGNLPFDVKDEEVYRLFSSIKDLECSIEAIRVIRDPGTSLGKGIAYVLFKTRDAANLAARKRNLKLRDRDLRLAHAKANTAHAKANTTAPKRKAPLPPETNKSPTKKLTVKVGFPGQENNMKSKAAVSYQGLRASKSGVLKKAHFKNNLVSHDVPKPEERLHKRPAVAARKAKALKAKQAGGIKRKPENQTPGSKSRRKKARKFT